MPTTESTGQAGWPHTQTQYLEFWVRVKWSTPVGTQITNEATLAGWRTRRYGFGKNHGGGLEEHGEEVLENNGFDLFLPQNRPFNGTGRAPNLMGFENLSGLEG